jgi:hypothetical protein
LTLWVSGREHRNALLLQKLDLLGADGLTRLILITIMHSVRLVHVFVSSSRSRSCGKIGSSIIVRTHRRDVLHASIETSFVPHR